MVGLVVAAHGHLATALVDAARVVVATNAKILAVGVGVKDTAPTFKIKMENAIREVDSGQGVLVLTDMFGGTPSNIGVTLLKPSVLEVVTGVNLPMLIKALQVCERSETPEELSSQVLAIGKRSIAAAGQLLGSRG